MIMLWFQELVFNEVVKRSEHVFEVKMQARKPNDLASIPGPSRDMFCVLG